MLADELREQINSTGVFRVLELDDLLPDEVKHDGIRLDPTKVTVDVASCGMTVDELQSELFERFNITGRKVDVQYADAAADDRHYALQGLPAVRRADAHRARETGAAPAVSNTRPAPVYRARFLPRDAYYASGELVPLLDDNDQVNRELAGRICCDQIVPYPPGIPVLVPGQRITDNIVEYLVRYLRVQNKVELHGVVYQGYVPSVRVLSTDEEHQLIALVASRPQRRRAA